MDELQLLRKLGFTEYETKLYLKLLELGPSKATELSKFSGVPKNKTYELLDKLVNEGLIECIPQNPKKYLIKTTSLLMNIVAKKEEELKSLTKGISSLEIKKNKPLTNIQELIWIVTGQEAFIKKIKESVDKLRKENFILLKKLKTNPTILRLTEQAIKRGAIVKLLVPKDTDKSCVKEWIRIGAKVRYLRNPQELAFSTFDDNLCRVNLIINNSIDDPTLWIESKPFVQILRERFKLLWKSKK